MWTASSAQSSMLTTVSLAPSSTTTSTLSASVIEPSNWSTTIALLKRSARMTTWAAVASSVPMPLIVTKTGRASSVSAGIGDGQRHLRVREGAGRDPVPRHQAAARP